MARVKFFLTDRALQEMVSTYLELANVYMRLDQPNTALDTYVKGAEKFADNIHLLLGIARVHEALNNSADSMIYYRKVPLFSAHVYFPSFFLTRRAEGSFF